MTIHFTSKKPQHLGNNVVMIIMKVQINSLFLIGTNINESVLMFLGHNTNLVIGKVRLKLFDFVQTARTQRDGSILV